MKDPGVRTTPVQPGPGTPARTGPDPTFETALPVVARRAANTAAFAVLGFALVALALRLPGVRPADALTVLLLAALVALVLPLARDHRRRRRAARAAGVPLRALTRSTTAVWQPSTGRPWGAWAGVVAADALLGPTRTTVTVALLAVAAPAGVVAVVLVVVLGRRSRRHQVAAARAAHPGAAVVPTALVDLASTCLARWAGATGAVLPDDLAVRGVLVAGPGGLVLRSVGRRARPLLRWGWDDVDLHGGRRLGAPDAAVLVLTLFAPGDRPRGAGRRRYDVTLTVRTGYGPVVPGAVGAALAHLLPRRPSPTSSRTGPLAGAS